MTVFAAGNNANTSLGRCEGGGTCNPPLPTYFPRVHFLPARHLARAALLLGGACLPYSASAQEVHVTEPEGAIAAIHVYNDWTAGSADGVINVETPRGTVSLRYESTPNGCDAICSADVVDVVAWPEGTLPDVARISIEELATGTIVLREWAGM